MSRIYDNWERLVAAVIKRQEIWELCHQHSRSPSICSETSSSDFSSSFRLSDEDKEESVQFNWGRIVLVEGSFTSTRPLGKGRFGDSILIELRRGIRISDHEFLAGGTQLVMKKLVGEVKVTEEEFKMVCGNCRHENVVAPRGCYFSNNKNFVFSDYHSQRSIYDLLHYDYGTSPLFDPALLWGGRLKIAIGAARGIAHIHKQCGGKLAHGNISSSNIFLNSKEYGLVSDFGLSGIMRISREQVCLDYHASYYEFKNASHESDVYSFGVLLIELLTGRSPLGPQKYQHVVAWALSIAPEDWSSKLFDTCIRRTLFVDELDMWDFVEERYSKIASASETFRSLLDSMEVEMVEMFQVATRCLAMLPVDRPKMFEVVLMLEKITWKHGALCIGEKRKIKDEYW
ncbi:hypothetical protein ACS0TY_004658 [Phlomoides rotata]